MTESSKSKTAPLPTGKIFCLSFQRTGTTSTGHFLRDLGYSCAGWETARDHRWPEAWLDGDFDAIFTSGPFQEATAFEDAPWFFPGFYKNLYHRFPNARFILLRRDPKEWFESMKVHSGGFAPGDPELHAKVYRREIDYYQRRQMTPPKKPVRLELEGWSQLYEALYQLHLLEVTAFFREHAPEALFLGELKDPALWSKMGHFLGQSVPSDYRCHHNKSAGYRNLPTDGVAS